MSWFLRRGGNDTLHGVNNNSNSALIKSFEWLLRVDINSYVFSIIQNCAHSYYTKQLFDQTSNIQNQGENDTNLNDARNIKSFDDLNNAPTTISGLPVCLSISSILVWKTGSTASTLCTTSNSMHSRGHLWHCRWHWHLSQTVALQRPKHTLILFNTNIVHSGPHINTIYCVVINKLTQH